MLSGNFTNKHITVDEYSVSCVIIINDDKSDIGLFGWIQSVWVLCDALVKPFAVVLTFSFNDLAGFLMYSNIRRHSHSLPGIHTCLQTEINRITIRVAKYQLRGSTEKHRHEASKSTFMYRKVLICPKCVHYDE